MSAFLEGRTFTDISIVRDKSILMLDKTNYSCVRLEYTCVAGTS